MYFKYNSGTKPFVFAVCIIENILADAFAPFSVFANKKFLLSIVNGFILLSQILLLNGICPSSKNVFDSSINIY